MSCSITCSIGAHDHCTVKCECACHREEKKVEKPDAESSALPGYESGLDEGAVKKPKKGKKKAPARPGDKWESKSKVSLEEVSMAEEREAARKPEDSE